MKKGTIQLLLLLTFLLIQLALYQFIVSGRDVTLRYSFGAICLCFLYGLTQIRRGNRLVVAGLAFTVMADFCLLMLNPIDRLWGMIFFLGTQSMYAVKLYRDGRNKVIVILRVLLSLCAMAAAFVVLGKDTDALALVSMCYYVNLTLNIIAAFGTFRKNGLFAVGLVLFLMCDTVVGLQVMSMLYLPMEKTSLLYQLLYPEYNLVWLFYLPSQVLIAASCRRGKK